MLGNYQWWEEALQGRFGMIHENEPQCGYYRVKTHKGGEFVPVAIWVDQETGELIAYKDGVEVDPCEIWTWCCRNPISADLYFEVQENGKPWPHEVTDEEIAYSNSSNAPENEIVSDEIDAVQAAFDNWLASIGGVITTHDQSDKAATFTERVAKLEKRAVEIHKREKEPFLSGGRRIDALWKPVAAKADDVKRSIKSVIGEFLKAEQKRRAELEAELNKGLPQGTVQVAPVKTGGAAKAISLRSKKVCQITDLKAASAFIAGLNSPPSDFTETVRSISQKLMTAGVDVPGAEIIEQTFAA